MACSPTPLHQPTKFNYATAAYSAGDVAAADPGIANYNDDDGGGGGGGGGGDDDDGSGDNTEDDDD